MFEDITKHRQAVQEQIQKGFEIGFTSGDSISKAHNVGDIHPNGKWVWTQLPSGKFDWRVIKQKQVESKEEQPKQLSKFSRQELREDYDHVEGASSNDGKKFYAEKYGVNSMKKADIQAEILKQLREARKIAQDFDKEDVRDFFRLDPGILKIKESLKEEGIGFVKFLKDYEFEYLKKRGLDKWIGMPISNNTWGLLYSDKDALKRYAKISEYLEEATPRPRTEKDKVFDALVTKFTNLLANYKKEYLERVRDYARERYNKTLPDKRETLQKIYAELKDKLSKLDWRKDREEYDKIYKRASKTRKQLDAIDGFFRRYPKLTDFIKGCEKDAGEEFEGNIRTLSDRIVNAELEIDKMVVKSVHSDPKVFNIKITDGTKNLYCRSILAAVGSAYMIPHYRFIITNRRDG